MTFPFESLVVENKEAGLIVAVLIGFGFGFVLERAGFGRSTKLAAQFYFHDMTVFKVMFSAIVTAMLGLVLVAGLGLAHLPTLSRQIASWTYVWPMLIGGLALGAGFIISGYCPGTSVVGAASGHIDAWVTFAGVVLGSLIYSETQPAIVFFHNSGELGAVFLYSLLGLPAPALALVVVLMAVACFIGAEKVEAVFTRKRAARQGRLEERPRPAHPRARRVAFATFGLLAFLALATLLAPVPTTDASVRHAEPIGPSELAHRVLDEPWNVRIIDVRSLGDCSAQRVPGSECVPADSIGNLGLELMSGHKDLVLVTGPEQEIPPEVMAYQGRVYRLENGFADWKNYALTIPEPPGPAVSEEDRGAYRFQAALFASLTGEASAVPPPPPSTAGYVSKKKKGGGGCN